jgi:hypothetical protein
MGDQERVRGQGSSVEGVARPGRDAETAPACLLKAEFIALVSGTVLANEVDLRDHVAACPVCRQQYEAFVDAAGRLRAPETSSEEPPLVKHARALRRWLPATVPTPPVGPATGSACGAPAPRRWSGRILHKILGSTPTSVVATMAVLLLVTVAFGATTVTFYLKHQAELLKLKEFRKKLALDTYVEFASASPEHPSTDPKRARPLAVVDRDIILAGKVAPHLIDRIEFLVEPGLEKGQDQWKAVVPIPETDKEEAVPFERRFTAPADGVLRKTTIRLVPRSHARAADPHGFAEDRLTYVVSVACLPAGVMAYVPPVAAPAILDVQRGADDRLIVTVEARTQKGSYVTIGFGAHGASRLVPVEAQRVNYYGQKLTFFVMLGVEDSYDIGAFALEQGQGEELAQAINTGKTEKLLVSDRKTVKK